MTSQSVMAGFILAGSLSLWVGIGSVFYKPRWNRLPMSVEGCIVANMSSFVNMTAVLPEVTRSSMTSLSPAVNVTSPAEAMSQG